MSRIPHISEPLFDAGSQKINDNWFRFFDGLQLAGAWTPALTFATLGDLSVTYLAQEGSYERIGRLVHVHFRIRTTAFTHTTASGGAQVTGLPFAAVGERSGTLLWQGITKANYTHIVPRTQEDSTTLTFGASGSGQTAAGINASDMPTGGTVRLEGDITYRAA